MSYYGGLRGELASLPADRRREIATFWETEVSEEELTGSPRRGQRWMTSWQSADALARDMASLWPALAVIEKLSPAERNILEAVATSEGPFQVKELIPACGRREIVVVHLASMLDRLVLSAFHNSYKPVSRPEWQAGVPLTAFLRMPDDLRAGLLEALALFQLPEDLLADLPLSLLLRSCEQPLMAMLLNIRHVLDRVVETGIERLLAAHLAYPEAINALLSGMGAGARRIFEELARTGEPVLLSRLPTGQRVDSPMGLLRQLHSRGLVFPMFQGGLRACYVHPVVAAAAAGKKPAPPEIEKLPPFAPEPAAVSGAGLNIWWNLSVLAGWIQSGDASLTASTHQIPRRAATQLSDVMAPVEYLAVHSEAKDTQADSAFSLFCTAQVVGLSDRKLLFTDAWEQWKDLGAIGQATMLLDWWQRPQEYLTRAVPNFPGVKDQVQATLIVRRKVLEMLQATPEGKWFFLREFAFRPLANDPFFMRPRAYIIENLGLPGIDDLYESWGFQEGQAIFLTLLDLPYILGLVEMGWAEGKPPPSPPSMMRLTPFGRQALDSIAIGKNKQGTSAIRLTKSEPSPTCSLIVQPNLEVVLMEFDPRVAIRLGEFARPLRFDRVAHYLLIPETVRAAVSRGLSVQDILTTLRDFSSQPIPQNVEYQIKDWAGTIRNIAFERGTIVETDSPEDLDALLDSKPIRGKLRRRLSPTVALLNVGADIEGLQRSLDALGFRWTPPADWESQERTAYEGLSRTLRRFQPRR
jgi:hypothetical protein